MPTSVRHWQYTANKTDKVPPLGPDVLVGTEQANKRQWRSKRRRCHNRVLWRMKPGSVTDSAHRTARPHWRQHLSSRPKCRLTKEKQLSQQSTRKCKGPGVGIQVSLLKEELGMNAIEPQGKRGSQGPESSRLCGCGRSLVLPQWFENSKECLCMIYAFILWLVPRGHLPTSAAHGLSG